MCASDTNPVVTFASWVSVRSYSRRKALKGTLIPGSSKVIYEAKLTKGDRILYTERLYNQNCRSVIVWCVSSHDKISTYAERIRDSYRKFEQRLLEQKKHAPCSMGAVDELLDETIMWVVLFPVLSYRLDLFLFLGWIQVAILCSELLNAHFSIWTVSPLGSTSQTNNSRACHWRKERVCVIAG